MDLDGLFQHLGMLSNFAGQSTTNTKQQDANLAPYKWNGLYASISELSEQLCKEDWFEAAAACQNDINSCAP